jgi:hypothetical protein
VRIFALTQRLVVATLGSQEVIHLQLPLTGLDQTAAAYANGMTTPIRGFRLSVTTLFLKKPSA